jgi:hypothetical protein|tara:strand:+ start:498 stop:695 length:198 start_codon:yes stop_codon:yes gene_type:complete
MVKRNQSGSTAWKSGDEVLFNDSLEGRRAKWEYIKTKPDVHAVVMACHKHFGKLEDVKIYRGYDL